MVKENKSLKVYLEKKKDFSVGFGKYKDKKLAWVARNDIEFFKEIEVLYYHKYDFTKKNHYDYVKKKFVTNNGFIATSNLKDIVQEAVSLLKQKKTSNQIASYLSEQRKLSGTQINIVMIDANLIIRREFDLERRYIVDVHMLRYEQIYESNINPNLEKVPAGYRKAVLCEHYINAMETLFQKEKLLGIHTKKFKLKINQLNTIIQKNTEFDMTQLSLNEQLEVLSLLNKAKPVEQLIRSSITDDSQSEITEAIVIEETKFESPIRLAKETDKIGDERALEVKETGKSLIDVQLEMKKNLENKVKELFEKKNKQ